MGQNHFLKNPKFDAEITIFSDSNPHVPTLKAPSRRIFFSDLPSGCCFHGGPLC
jgi:hypothetical protein